MILKWASSSFICHQISIHLGPLSLTESQGWCAAQAAASLNGGVAEFPDFVPDQVNEIQEEAALNMVRAMQRCTLAVPSLGEPVETAYVEENSGRLYSSIMTCHVRGP